MDRLGKRGEGCAVTNRCAVIAEDPGASVLWDGPLADVQPFTQGSTARHANIASAAVRRLRQALKVRTPIRTPSS
jgi:hypothetical protein